MSTPLGANRSRPLALLAVVGAVFGLFLFARGGAWAQSASITVDPAALGASTAVTAPRAVDDLAATAQSDSVLAPVNAAPVFAAGSSVSFSVPENTKIVGLVGASDADVGDTLLYGLSKGDIDHFSTIGAFSIGGTGWVTFLAAPSFESGTTRFETTVYVRDSRDAGGNPDTAWDDEIDVTVDVTDVNEPPAAPTSLVVTAAAGALEVSWTAPAAAAMAGKPAVSGYDVQHSARAAGGAASGWGAWVDAGHKVTGTSVIVSGLAAGSTHRVRVRAKSPEGDSAWLGPVSGVPAAPAPVNAAPVFAAGSSVSFSVPENTKIVGLVGASDADVGDTLLYGLSQGDIDHFSTIGAFSIGGTGWVTFLAAPSFESGTTRFETTVYVRDSRDADGNPDTAWDDEIDVTVDVTDVNEPPVFAGASASATAAENQTAVTGSPAAADPDAGDTVTYGIDASSGDGASFNVDAGTGVLSFKAAPDYEAKGSYTVTVRARDGRDAAGVADTAWDDSIYVTVTDVDEPPPQRGAEPEPATGGAAGEAAGFTDTTGSVHRDSINRIARAGITLGCNPPANDRFCPRRAVTRAQMASFLARALKLPAAARDYFTDTAGSVHRDSINRIARAGITLGCNPPANDRFCPRRAVTRAQMASFLARALKLPAAARDYFTDTTGSVHRDSINRIARAGITLGCNPPANDRFCPRRAVTRAQMASFLSRALKLPDPTP